MTRREVLRVVLRSAGGLTIVRCVPGCALPEGLGANDNTPANGNDNTPVNGNDNAPPNDNDNAPANGNDNAADAALLRLEDIDHVQGDREAPNVIIQYADFEDPVCGAFFSENKPRILSELVETGQAAFGFRHFPIASLHPNARLAAVASECAVDFFEYHDLLFNHQDALTREDLVAYAEEVGLNTTPFESCLTSSAKVPRVDRDVDSGTRLGVVETPTFFVNGQVLTGNPTLEDFQRLLS